MERTESDLAYLERIVAAIDDTELSCIDFDELKEQLQETANRLRVAVTLAGEHAKLREDYEKRIGGMIKAIAAVDRKRDAWEDAATLAGQLSEVDIDRLLELHRQIAARFRSHFPGSFGLLRKQ